MNWQQRYQIRHFLRYSFWPLPTLCIVLAILFGFMTRWLDSQVSYSWMGFSSEGARSLLGGLASSLLTFLVFVVTSMLLVVQIASSQLTPRIIAMAFSNRLSQLTLSLFVFTYTFTLATLGRIEEKVPQLTTMIAVVLTVASLVVLFWFAQRLGSSLRPIAILQTVGENLREVVDEVYPTPFSGDEQRRTDLRLMMPTQESRTVNHTGRSGVFMAFGATPLLALAARHDCVVEIIPQVGNFVPKGDPLFRVYPGTSSLTDELLHECVVVGPERTLEQDPAFGFRIMVDIAARALSPAINDPTTAVMALDQIHRFLYYVGTRQLSDGTMFDATQRLRLVFSTPNWENFVELAVTEIRMFGVASIQIPRRIRAMLEHLLDVLAVARRPALQKELAALQAAVTAAFHSGPDLLRAEASDRQGIGGIVTPAEQPERSA